MITKLETKNFTVLRDAQITFSQDLNVIIGENGSGKTHILKLLYSILSCFVSIKTENISKQLLQQRIADKLIGVFRPDQLGRLTTRKQGRERAEVKIYHKNSNHNCEFSFATNSKTEVNVIKMPTNTNLSAPVFFPAKEILTIYPKFVSMYETFYLQYDETYKETMTLLGRAYLKGPHENKVKELINSLEEAIGGHIFLDKKGDCFYFLMNGEKGSGAEMEINLVAEGWRKLGMLTQVVLNGALKDKGFLFWDEPEANLNPCLVKELAKSIYNLSQSNIQVFITTHSLFLMRELEYLAKSNKKENSVRYIGLHSGGMIEQSYETSDLRDITSLDEELLQADRILSGKY